MPAKTWIVTATLDADKGADTVRRAWAVGGIPADIYVSVDAKHEGGVKTANRALKAAVSTPALYIAYINDDIEAFPQNWLRRMIEALGSSLHYGAAGPSGKCGTWPQQSGRRGMPAKVTQVDRLSFFVVVFKREVLEQVGLLDERFIHYACDGDYCMRMKLLGWQPVWVQDVWVEHRRSPIVRDWKVHDVAEFRKKWHRS